MAKTKKVVILIVEGQSEESLLFERLQELFKDSLIHFAVQRGDIFNKRNDRKGIKASIGDLLNKVINERKFKKTDIIAVLHIVDTDGSFIKDDKIIIDESQDSNTVYHLENITVKNAHQKDYMEKRNVKRGQGILTMNSVDSVLGGKVLYQIYYFSRHLEHVLFDEPNPIDDTKIDAIDDFLEELSIPIEQFLAEWMPIGDGMQTDNKYTFTWNYIESETNSLKRGANVSLLFDMLEKLLK